MKDVALLYKRFFGNILNTVMSKILKQIYIFCVKALVYK